MSDVVIVIPAAGASSRMRGGDKLLEMVDGQPVLARIAARALATGARVLVALPPDRPKRAAALESVRNARLITVDVPEAYEGMAASIRTAAQWVLSQPNEEQFAGLMIAPADMPELETDDFQNVIKSFSGDPKAVVRASSADGTPGHPVVFPARLFAALTRMSGDQGARAVLKGEAVTLAPLPGQHALTDLDTPEDWAEWRERTGR